MPETISDVVVAKNKKGIWVYKSQTDAGRAALGAIVGGPWEMAKEVFAQQNDGQRDKIDRQLGNVTVADWEAPKPKPIDVKSLTEF